MHSAGPFRPIATQPNETQRYLAQERTELPPRSLAPRPRPWLRLALDALAGPAVPPAAQPSRGYLRRT